MYAVTAQVAKHRYIFIFGGANDDCELPADNIENIRIFDSEKVNCVWQILHLQNPSGSNRIFYGVFPLGLSRDSEEDNNFDFLIFGGADNYGNEKDSIMILSTCFSEFKASQLRPLK